MRRPRGVEAPGDAAPREPAAQGRSVLLAREVALDCFQLTAAVAAVAVPLGLPDIGLVHPRNSLVATLVVVLALAVLNVEIGRLLDAGQPHSRRPHRALSTWAFCTALLLPVPYLLPVVVVSYLHAVWRGQRVGWRTGIASGSFLVLAGVAAAAVSRWVMQDDPNLMVGAGGRGLVAVFAATAVFLAVETGLLALDATLDVHLHERWLRRPLTGRTLYATEASLLLMGGLSAAVWDAGPWFLVLLVPVYFLGQRALLSESLRERADTDDKTGLLRFESWQQLATTEQARCHERGRSWSVAFVDLDHFKVYNDTYGHLAGDAALAAVADVLSGQLRSRDLVGRFGGEEFCMLLPEAPLQQAALVAERLRQAVEDCELPVTGQRVTISVGVVSVTPASQLVPLSEALAAADRALFAAKSAGRNQVFAHDYEQPTRSREVTGW